MAVIWTTISVHFSGWVGSEILSFIWLQLDGTPEARMQMCERTGIYVDIVDL
jgi:hypothetical protein